MLRWFKSLFKSNTRRELEALEEQVSHLLEITKAVPGDTLEARVHQLLIWSEMSEAQ